jgi:hypothetical protein
MPQLVKPKSARTPTYCVFFPVSDVPVQPQTTVVEAHEIHNSDLQAQYFGQASVEKSTAVYQSEGQRVGTQWTVFKQSDQSDEVPFNYTASEFRQQRFHGPLLIAGLSEGQVRDVVHMCTGLLEAFQNGFKSQFAENGPVNGERDFEEFLLQN